jgi:hypothetical protein
METGRCHYWLILVLLGLFVCSESARGDSMVKAPANIQAALFAKLLGHNKKIGAGGNVKLYVVGETQFAAAMKPVVGRKMGNSQFASVEEGPVPAEGIPDVRVIYVGDIEQWDAIKAYCRKYKILSITGLPQLEGKGVTLSVGVADKKPRVVLDMEGSKAEEATWSPEVMKVATVINK